MESVRVRVPLDKPSGTFSSAQHCPDRRFGSADFPRLGRTPTRAPTQDLGQLGHSKKNILRFSLIFGVLQKKIKMEETPEIILRSLQFAQIWRRCNLTGHTCAANGVSPVNAKLGFTPTHHLQVSHYICFF